MKDSGIIAGISSSVGAKNLHITILESIHVTILQAMAEFHVDDDEVVFVSSCLTLDYDIIEQRQDNPVHNWIGSSHVSNQSHSYCIEAWGPGYPDRSQAPESKH